MIKLIPAIDIIDGHCVRLTKGDYAKKTEYNGTPLQMALRFEKAGFNRLHVVDLDGARSKHVVNLDTLSQITLETSLTVDFGGGIKSGDDIEKAFSNGAAMVTVGSVAVTHREQFCQWLKEFGSDRVILGADVRSGKVSINGWKEDTMEDIIPFLRYYVDHGVRHVLCTDISKDGTLQGPAYGLYHQIMQTFPDLDLIASGGVSGLADLRRLNAEGIPSAVFGKAVYEGHLNIDTLLTDIQKPTA